MDLIRRLGGALLLPLPIAILLLVAGLALLWLRRRERLGRILATAGTLLLLIASTAPLPRLALGALEDDYPPYLPDATAPAVVPERPTAAGPSWIVVLCGGGGDAPGRPDLAGLSTHTLGRLTEGVRIARLHPEARLLFTGGAISGLRPCSDVMRGAAVELGVDPARIEIDTRSRTTEDEAVAVERVVGDEPFVLVTAASHLPRALALVRARGLDPVPAPAAPRVVGERSGIFGAIKPDADVLVGSHLWAHEVVGRIWSGLRGRL